MPDDAQVPPEPPPTAPPPPPSDPPPPGAGGTGGGNVSDNRSLWLILSYLGPLALIPFLAEQEDQEVQWHAKHGLVITGGWILIGILASILSFATGGCLGCFLPVPIVFGMIIVAVLGITKAMNGERFIIPSVSELADKF